MPSLVLGTAGHIDHGKSALITALTGTDPDRLAEETNSIRNIMIGKIYDQSFEQIRKGQRVTYV